MEEIKCPRCGEVFQVDDSGYAKIAQQVRDKESKAELQRREKEIAEKLLQQLRDKGYDVKTTVEPFTKFWNAEEYHQDYYERKGTTPYCHRYQKRF